MFHKKGFIKAYLVFISVKRALESSEFSLDWSIPQVLEIASKHSFQSIELSAL
jgi:hypothetical protein